ncbi:hypothetical protein B0H67DRAFT_578016 [Lasiosphaeris hirsuta]|uniref:Uncharacterized protein n=1 Tax=Lasiosphaeris hirsuta TaxID=260670 RepID=A0AA40AS73_9PEZI|nr:hypothetical protein B0H67DRAFT_578016 [Lasiosphaeris hirsuta]
MMMAWAVRSAYRRLKKETWQASAGFAVAFVYHFRASFSFPASVDQDGVQAKFNHGVLQRQGSQGGEQGDSQDRDPVRTSLCI